MPLLGFFQLGNGFIAGFAQDFARFEAAARAGDDLVAAHVGIAASGRENAEVSHDSMANNVAWHSNEFAIKSGCRLCRLVYCGRREFYRRNSGRQGLICARKSVAVYGDAFEYFASISVTDQLRT